MILNLKRYISLLLVLMLLIGIIPTAYAAELPIDSIVPEETLSAAVETTVATEPEESGESTDPTEPTDPTDPTVPAEVTGSTEVTEPTEPAGDDPMLLTDSDDYGIMTAATTSGSIMLFDYSDNGNYTSSLNSQITVKYKWNGSGSTLTCYLKNFGWHFARYGGVAYADEPLYCIEPHRDYAASTSGNSVDRGVTLDGSGSTSGSNVWFSLNADRREAIGLILLYTDELWDHSISVTTTAKANNPNVPLRMAAQFLIFEIICGLRDAETFVRNSSNESGTSGDIFYNAGSAAISYFAPNYNQLVSLVQGAMEIPSFTSRSSSTAPTITLDGEETSVYDSNGVLSDFFFTDKGGAEFYMSGNTLYITQTGTISESTVHTATKSIPSAENSTYSIYYMSGSTYQTTISLYTPETGSLNAYFKLKAPASGSLNLKKTTEDGENLSGWEFGIYSDSACTTLLSGPHTTDANGNISITGLTPGTVYVKELGHTDSTIEAQYVCTSENPQKVTITNGATAAVTFVNQRRGQAQIVKTATNGGSVAGWHFEVKNSSGTVIGTYVTDATGIITLDLDPGTYTVTETDGAVQYWENDPNPTRTVTVKAGETAKVAFENQYKGEAQIIKATTNGGSVAGWHFEVKNSSGTVIDNYVTDDTGIITLSLEPGTYTVTETDGESQYWQNDPNPTKTVTVKAGQTAKVTFTNKYQGEAQIIKTATNGGTVAGWHFEVKDSDGNVIGNYVTDSTGIITLALEPGTYTVTETDGEVEYWENDSNPTKTVTVKAGQTAKVTFTNKWLGKAKVIKTATNGGTVQGWTFTIKNASGTFVGKYTTDENGLIVTDLEPGTYTVQETSVDDPYWVCDTEVKTITVKAGETATVSFKNQYVGRAKIIKTLEDPDSGTVEGWTFEVKASDGSLVGTYTTGADGTILCDLAPGTYTVTEILDEDSYWECVSEITQTVTVKGGQTAEVTFTNALRPADILVYKVDTLGVPLAEAEFLLEWSEDGINWNAVTYTDSDKVIKGGCTSVGLKDGKLVSGKDGIVHFTGLHPELQYRLTETKAPEGYHLLSEPAYEGCISPDETLTVELTVVNAPVYELPMTGSTGSTVMRILQIAGAIVLLASLLYIVKKRR